MARSVDVGDIFKATAQVVKDGARDLGLFTLILGGLTAIGVALGLTETAATTVSMGFSIDATDTSTNGLFDLLAGVLSLVLGYMLVKQFLARQGLLRAEGNRFWLYLGMIILTMIGLLIGFLLLIVPGVILMVRWSASTGYLLGKGDGVVESLSSSWRATRGHGWSIFLAGLLLIIAVFIVVGGLSAALLEVSATAGGIVTAFLEAATNGVLLAFGVAIYKLVADDATSLDEVFS